MTKPKEVREPIQVYLDARDRATLDEVAKLEGVPRSEVLRLALRRLGADLLAEARPGAAISALIGVLDAAIDVPADLAERHDDYLYGAEPVGAERAR